ncbi:MAG: class I SAM-dependent methyltransferase [Ilumatobacter sp.]|uniref:class I SAM-dependent methyltransferase n=1 Tax=Ilumatobacter sp. TaxID=1967498 RepID=UPI00391A739B
MSDATWDERYSKSEYVWTDTVNQFVQQYLSDLPPGSAVDLGAGEGRNAVWLARRGWSVTAVDFSAVGLDKGRRLAADHEVDVEWVVADATTWQSPRPVDLVVLSYLQLEVDDRRTAVEHAASWLAPGGRVFVIAHDQSNVEHGVGGPPSTAVCYDVAETVSWVDGLSIPLVVDVAEVAQRRVGDEVALDTLVIAVRPRD